MRRREVVVHQPMGAMTGQVTTLPANVHTIIKRLESKSAACCRWRINSSMACKPLTPNIHQCLAPGWCLAAVELLVCPVLLNRDLNP